MDRTCMLCWLRAISGCGHALRACVCSQELPSAEKPKLEANKVQAAAGPTSLLSKPLEPLAPTEVTTPIAHACCLHLPRTRTAGGSSLCQIAAPSAHWRRRLLSHVLYLVLCSCVRAYMRALSCASLLLVSPPIRARLGSNASASASFNLPRPSSCRPAASPLLRQTRVSACGCSLIACVMPSRWTASSCPSIRWPSRR